MNERYSEASKLRWAQIPQEVRKERMSALAKKKALAMTQEERTAHAKMMRSRVGKKVI